MTATPMLRLSRPALAGAVLVLSTGACGDPIQGPSGDEATEPLSTLIVSNPSPSALLDGTGVSASGASATDGIVFVSLPPGSVPDGERMVVRVRSTGVEATAVMADGGFDPTPVAATAGDTLNIRIERTGRGPLDLMSVVPSSRPPMVVRTDPPPKKRDVPLNARMLVVFSEPIDAATLTASSVRLLLDGAPVAGGLDFVDGANLAVSFTPAEPLAPGTDYAIWITQEIRDLDGEPLPWGPVAVPFTTGEPAAPATLALVSGNDQPGKAGRELSEPLVVRVTDASGAGVAGVEVTWTVTSGEGVMDGLWIPCPDYLMSSAELLSHPVPSTSVRTGSDGLARISFMPTWFGPVTVRASFSEAAVTFSTDASDPEASLEVVPGYADAYEPWVWADGGTHFQPPLAVTVRDGRGAAVPYVRVHWDSEPAGLMSGCPDWWYFYGAATRTQADGVVQSRAGFVLATTKFGPGDLGPTTVTADVPGVQNSPLTFTRNVTTAFIYLAPPEGFTGPDRSSDVVVPIGTRVEFPVFSEAAHIVSTSSPPGGVTFDSGPLDRDEILFWDPAAYDPEAPVAPERFGFVPNVTGTWTFVDQVSGATGTLTAR